VVVVDPGCWPLALRERRSVVLSRLYRSVGHTCQTRGLRLACAYELVGQQAQEDNRPPALVGQGGPLDGGRFFAAGFIMVWLDFEVVL
jgi:hypothetical protein